MTKRKVLFEDRFDEPAGPYDHAKWGEWSTATYNGSAAYGRIQPGDRATLDGKGRLRIPATPTAGTCISTKDHFSFGYGTVTARMRLPRQAGYWPACWLLNSPPDGSNADLVGEVDVIEGYTTFNDGYMAGGHNYANGADRGPTGGAWHGTYTDVRGAWHNYSATITPDHVAFAFDGTEFFRFGPNERGLAGQPWAWGPDAKNWLLLTNAIDVARPAPTVDSVLLVDRVTVTAL